MSPKTGPLAAALLVAAVILFSAPAGTLFAGPGVRDLQWADLLPPPDPAAKKKKKTARRR